jgi:murein DD-endopeptidase MepM/ murein hydrolase activator NlpD
MRLGELASRVCALAVAMGVATSAATAGTGLDDTVVPLAERVFFDRSALSSDIGGLFASEASRIVALPGDSLSHGVTGDLLPAKAGRGAVVVLAAVAPSKGASLTDVGPHLLPWIVPAVPPLLSKPSAKSAPPEDRLPVLEDPLVRVLEQRLAARPANRPERVLGGKKNLSEPSQPALSKLPGEAPMSGRWTDPLGSPDGEEEVAASEPKIEFIMPFANGRVTSLFNQGRRHPAIDLAGALGSPVLATTTRQTVVFAAGRGGYGNAVITRDELGRTHLYGHLKSITSRVGQVLEQGEKLGHLGSTGFSTGPHVHYEVTDRKGRHIDPVTLLFPDRRVVKGYAWLDVRQEQKRANVVADAQLTPAPGRVARPARAARHRLGMRPSARTHRWACRRAGTSSRRCADSAAREG